MDNYTASLIKKFNAIEIDKKVGPMPYIKTDVPVLDNFFNLKKKHPIVGDAFYLNFYHMDDKEYTQQLEAAWLYLLGMTDKEYTSLRDKRVDGKTITDYLMLAFIDNFTECCNHYLRSKDIQKNMHEGFKWYHTANKRSQIRTLREEHKKCHDLLDKYYESHFKTLRDALLLMARIAPITLNLSKSFTPDYMTRFAGSHMSIFKDHWEKVSKYQNVMSALKGITTVQDALTCLGSWHDCIQNLVSKEYKEPRHPIDMDPYPVTNGNARSVWLYIVDKMYSFKADMSLEQKIHMNTMCMTYMESFGSLANNVRYDPYQEDPKYDATSTLRKHVIKKYCEEFNHKLQQHLIDFEIDDWKKYRTSDGKNIAEALCDIGCHSAMLYMAEHFGTPIADNTSDDSYEGIKDALTL